MQVALKAAHKQLAATQAQLKAAQAAATAAAQQHANALAADKSSPGSNSATGSGPTAAASAAAQAEADSAVRQKLAQLEGALRQASADYALILGELSKIRGEGAERQAALEAALAGKAAAESEVLRWAFVALQFCTALCWS